MSNTPLSFSKKYTTQEEDDVIIECAKYVNKSYLFILFAFPWGEPGTSLANKKGPEPWQKKLLQDLDAGLISFSQAIRLARTSGHGIGKSALVAWLIIWAMATFEDTKGVVTANTENQLKTKTWAELAKWHRMSICKDYFKLSATKYYSADPAHENTWKVDMVPWSERNTEAFAGLHNEGKRILIIFDEGSGIPDIIWEVTEGAMTDMTAQILFIVFGNPTRNSGRFRECFDNGKFAHRWNNAHIDSREVSFTNKKQISEWLEDYGDDSDFVRIRIKGIFPRIDGDSFISREAAIEAVEREIIDNKYAQVVLGVDVARFGEDFSVIYPRAGRDGFSRPVQIYHGLSIVELSREVIIAASAYYASTIYIDGGGVGGGLVDILRSNGLNVHEVIFSTKPDNTNVTHRNIRYKNKRAEIWGEMREWLKTGSIQNKLQGQQHTLVDELSGPRYTVNDRDEITLENKRLMQHRDVPNPNVADALACTFAMPDYIPLNLDENDLKPVVAKDYDPFAFESIYA